MILGIDIGGTKMRAVLLSKSQVKRTVEIPTPKNISDFQKRLTTFSKFINLGGKIGIGVPGLVGGTAALFCPNIPYLKKFNFKKFLPDFEIKVENDARCFALAESLDSNKPYKNIFLITIGTGIGRAVVQKGKVRKIKRFEAPEKWEKEYQRVRETGNDKKLAFFLASKLFPLARSYRADTLMLGGGVLERKKLFPLLKKELSSLSFGVPVQKIKFKKNAGAFGAALLWS